MHRLFVLISVLAGAGLASAGEAGAWEGDVKFSTRLWDNFFQANEGDQAIAVTAGAVQAKVSRGAPSLSPSLSWYIRGAGIWYDEFDDLSTEIGGGLRFGGKPTSLDVDLGYYWDRPRFDVGESFDRASGGEMQVRLGHRVTADWEVKGSFSYIAEHQAVKESLDNRGTTFGAGLRYRGFGYVFSPELGYEWGTRGVDTENSEYDQGAFYVKVRSAPARWLYLTSRYRQRARDYTVADPTASNFGREDTRRLLTVSADVRTGEHLVWTAYYALQDSDSSRPSRGFQTQQLEIGLTLEF